MDRSFLIPKVNVALNIISQYMRNSDVEYFTLYIFKNYLVNRFETEFSELKDTGGEISLNFDENGYTITMSVFSDLVYKVCDRLMEIVFNPSINEEDFKQFMETSIDQLNDNLENQPFKKAQDLFKKIIKHGVSSREEMIAVYNRTLTYDTFDKTLSKLIATFKLNSLFYGYMKEDKLEEVVDQIFSKHLNHTEINTSNATSVNSPVENVIDIFKLNDYLHTNKLIKSPVVYRTINNFENEHNHLVYNYFQVGIRDYKTSLIMNIIQMIWGNMFYYSLRTVKQLGYIVSANKELTDNYMYFTFVVQGNKADPAVMNLEIDKVLSNLRDKISSLSEEKFNEIKTSLKNELQGKDTNLKERTQRIWNEIYLNTLDFRRKDNLIRAIPEIEKSDILSAYDNIFIEKPRKLSIQIYAGTTENLQLNDENYYLNSNIVVKVKNNITNILTD
jgi:secreted Zn-dependent insulinase-like peptidase